MLLSRGPNPTFLADNWFPPARPAKLGMFKLTRNRITYYFREEEDGPVLGGNRTTHSGMLGGAKLRQQPVLSNAVLDAARGRLRGFHPEAPATECDLGPEPNAEVKRRILAAHVGYPFFESCTSAEAAAAVAAEEATLGSTSRGGGRGSGEGGAAAARVPPEGRRRAGHGATQEAVYRDSTKMQQAAASICMEADQMQALERSIQSHVRLLPVGVDETDMRAVENFCEGRGTELVSLMRLCRLAKAMRSAAEALRAKEEAEVVLVEDDEVESEPTFNVGPGAGPGAGPAQFQDAEPDAGSGVQAFSLRPADAAPNGTVHATATPVAAEPALMAAAVDTAAAAATGAAAGGAAAALATPLQLNRSVPLMNTQPHTDARVPLEPHFSMDLSPPPQPPVPAPPPEAVGHGSGGGEHQSSPAMEPMQVDENKVPESRKSKRDAGNWRQGPANEKDEGARAARGPRRRRSTQKETRTNTN